MRITSAFAGAIASLLMAGVAPASAQSVPPPIPDLAVPEKELGDERKYVVFHKPGVSYEDALRDMSACARHASRTTQRTAPGFVPWGRDEAGQVVAYDGLNFGLVGLAIGAIIDGPIERSVRQTTMIRCLTPRGYVRYRAGKDQWQELFEKNEDWIPIAAAIASGPTPPTPKANP
jgi:hypothetical protein